MIPIRKVNQFVNNSIIKVPTILKILLSQHNVCCKSFGQKNADLDQIHLRNHCTFCVVSVSMFNFLSQITFSIPDI